MASVQEHSALKGLVLKLTHSESQRGGSSLKNVWAICEADILINLGQGHVLEGQGSDGTFFRNGGTGKRQF